MWKLICKNEFPHLLTIQVTWSKTNCQQTTTHTNNRWQVENKSLRLPIFSIGQYDIHRM